MMQINELFSQLDLSVQQAIHSIYVDIHAYLSNTGENAWHNLHTVMAKHLEKINFPELIAKTELRETYVRIPYTLSHARLCIVLFVFKHNERAAVLIHVYSDLIPNKTFYSWGDVVNPIKSKGHNQKRTLPHSHRAKCYSFVAFVCDKVSVTEESFQLAENGKLILLDQTNRAVGSYSFDPADIGYIHSISVHFHL